MATANQYKFDPDYAAPPGTTLREVLETQGISQSELSARMGMTDKTISQIINGIAPISFDTAFKLELVLGVPATFWNRMELAYRERLTKIEETQKLESEIEWLKEVPVRELIAREYIEPTKDKTLLVRQLLEFFGVSSVAAWRDVLQSSAVQFRGGEAHKKYPGYVAAWRRLGVMQAQEIATEPFNAQEFVASLKAVLRITALPAEEWEARLSALCSPAGVAVVLTPEIPKASISGAARWLTKDKAMIQLSLKYKTDDQFWFSFFHEAGHILKHGKKQVFVDYGYSNEGDEEREANEFARDFLIPPEYTNRFPVICKSRSLVSAFAKELKISPGIVVGRLQHDGFLYPSAFHDLKCPIAWGD